MSNWGQRAKEDKVREVRITMDVVVDAYDEVERSLSWYYYLQDNLSFPLVAQCIVTTATSSLRAGDEVEVTGMPAESDCEQDMLVNIHWKSVAFAVPLSQLKPIIVDGTAQEAIADWHYWVAQGRQF